MKTELAISGTLQLLELLCNKLQFFIFCHFHFSTFFSHLTNCDHGAAQTVSFFPFPVLQLFDWKCNERGTSDTSPPWCSRSLQKRVFEARLKKIIKNFVGDDFSRISFFVSFSAAHPKLSSDWLILIGLKFNSLPMKLRWSKPSKGPKKAGKPNNAIAHYATCQFSLMSLAQLDNDL